MILGYGCNVPAINSTRILETHRERLLAAFAITFAPCACDNHRDPGLVVYVNVWWALALYAIDILVIFIMGRLALKVVPGETPVLWRYTHLNSRHYQLHLNRHGPGQNPRYTWFSRCTSSPVQPYRCSTPLVSSHQIANALAPITVVWLDLPVVAGLVFIWCGP